MSPVPPWPLWQAFTIADSIGYIPNSRPTKNPVAISGATVETITAIFAAVRAATSVSHGRQRDADREEERIGDRGREEPVDDLAGELKRWRAGAPA